MSTIINLNEKCLGTRSRIKNKPDRTTIEIRRCRRWVSIKKENEHDGGGGGSGGGSGGGGGGGEP